MPSRLEGQVLNILNSQKFVQAAILTIGFPTGSKKGRLAGSQQS